MHTAQCGESVHCGYLANMFKLSVYLTFVIYFVYFFNLIFEQLCSLSKYHVMYHSKIIQKMVIVLTLIFTATNYNQYRVYI